MITRSHTRSGPGAISRAFDELTAESGGVITTGPGVDYH